MKSGSSGRAPIAVALGNNPMPITRRIDTKYIKNTTVQAADPKKVVATRT
jgi:hypothetical protein